MILLDERLLPPIGHMSARFLPYFNGLGVPAWLEYGDAVFWAWDKSSTICAEIKRVLDLLISIERTGRLEQQMRSARQVHRAYYLVLHGFKYIGANREGMVSQWTRDGWKPIVIPDRVVNGRTEGHQMSYRRMDNYLNSLATLEGVVIKQTRDEQETARVIVDLYWWWSKDIEEHTSTMRLPEPAHLPYGTIGLVRRVAAELRGVGLQRSKAVEQRFDSVEAMVAAEEKDWRGIEGIGAGLAKRIVRELRGEVVQPRKLGPTMYVKE